MNFPSGSRRLLQETSRSLRLLRIPSHSLRLFRSSSHSLRLFRRLLQPWMVFFALILVVRVASAQQGFANWGSGAYSAMPRCNYELRAGRDVVKFQDALDGKKRELQGVISKANTLKRRLEANKQKERSNRDQFRTLIRDNGIQGEDFNMMEFHINSGRRATCADYGGFPTSSYFNFTPPELEEEVARAPADETRTRRRGGARNVRAPFREAFFGSCEDGGKFSDQICSEIMGSARGADPSRCERSLKNWQDAVDARGEMEDALRSLEDQIRDLELQANLTNSELEDSRRRAEEDMRKIQTEGGCVGCLLARGGSLQQERPAWLDIAGVAAQAFLGYSQANSYNKIAKAQIDADAKIGFRSNGSVPMNAFGYGGGIMANGLLGLLGGGLGQGGYGCSGSPNGAGFPMGAAGLAGPFGAMNVNGAFGMGNPMQNALFGFPQGMYGTPPGAGMFLPGVGMNFQAGLGSQAYCPRWPCPTGPGMYGPGMGFGGQAGFRPGMPGFGGQFGGMPGMGGPFGGMPGYGPGGIGFQGGMGGPFGGMPGFANQPFGGYAPGGFAGYRPGMPGMGGQFGGMPGYGPGGIGFQAGVGFGNPYGAANMPGAFGIPYGGNVYGNAFLGGGPMGANMYGGGFGGNPMGGQAYALQAQAQQAQYMAQQAAMQAQQAQQQQYAYTQWLNNYQAGVQQLNMIGGQMSQLQQAYYSTQAQLSASAPPMMGGAYGGMGASAYLGIDFNLFRGYSPYGGAQQYNPYGGTGLPGFAPGPPPPPPALPGAGSGVYTR